MSEETKDIKLTDEEYTKKLENAIEDLNNHCDKLQQENQQLKSQLELYETYLNRFFKINNKSYDGKVVLEQLQHRDEVIDEVIDVINKMITIGYTDEKRLTSYFAVSKDSEFGRRAEVILDILNKYKNN